MNLLDYGIKNENSGSILKRALAKGALTAEMKKADLYEAYLSARKLCVPEDAEADKKIMDAIQKGIAAHDANTASDV